MSGGAKENEEMLSSDGKGSEPFSEHSLAHVWKGGGPVVNGGTQAGGDIYLAWCQDCPYEGGWKGPPRATKEQAQADADAHNASNPGHRAGVM